MFMSYSCKLCELFILQTSQLTNSQLVIILITRYRDIDRGFVECTISWRPYIVRYRARAHVSHVRCSHTAAVASASACDVVCHAPHPWLPLPHIPCGRPINHAVHWEPGRVPTDVWEKNSRSFPGVFKEYFIHFPGVLQRFLRALCVFFSQLDATFNAIYYIYTSCPRKKRPPP